MKLQSYFLIINGEHIDYTSPVTFSSPDDEYPYWEFVWDNGHRIIATGNIVLKYDGKDILS